MASFVDFLDAPPNAAQNDDSAFLITDDDDSHDTPHLIQTEIDGIQPFPFSLSDPVTGVTVVQAKRYTVLKL